MSDSRDPTSARSPVPSPAGEVRTTTSPVLPSTAGPNDDNNNVPDDHRPDKVTPAQVHVQDAADLFGDDDDDNDDVDEFGSDGSLSPPSEGLGENESDPGTYDGGDGAPDVGETTPQIREPTKPKNPRIVQAITIPRRLQPPGLEKSQIIKFPSFLDIRYETFEEESFVEEEEDGPVVIRFMKDDEGNVISNARIITWNDGSKSLIVGDEWFEVVTTDLGLNRYFIGFQREDCAPGLITNFSSLKTAVTFRPYNTASSVHRRLRDSINQKHARRGGTMMVVSDVDPEMQKHAAERAEADRIRSQRRLEAKHRAQERRYEKEEELSRYTGAYRSRESGGLTEGLLEDGEDVIDDGEDGEDGEEEDDDDYVDSAEDVFGKAGTNMYDFRSDESDEDDDAGRGSEHESDTGRSNGPERDTDLGKGIHETRTSSHKRRRVLDDDEEDPGESDKGRAVSSQTHRDPPKKRRKALVLSDEGEDEGEGKERGEHGEIRPSE